MEPPKIALLSEWAEENANLESLILQTSELALSRTLILGSSPDDGCRINVDRRLSDAHEYALRAI